MESNSESDSFLDTVPDNDLIRSNELVQVNSKWKILNSTMNMIIHTLLGGSVFITLRFTCSLDGGPFEQHIILCVLGYQLLMSHGILMLSSSTWSSISYRNKRRLHWILQLVGSVLSITGSFIMMKHVGFTFKSLHGKFGLAALIFSCVSLINGLTSLYAVELRRFIPANVFKISHIFIGTAAFVLSSVCLALGYNKTVFKNNISTEFASVMIVIVSVNTVLVITAPCFKLFKLVKHALSRTR